MRCKIRVKRRVWENGTDNVCTWKRRSPFYTGHRDREVKIEITYINTLFWYCSSSSSGYTQVFFLWTCCWSLQKDDGSLRHVGNNNSKVLDPEMQTAKLRTRVRRPNIPFYLLFLFLKLLELRQSVPHGRARSSWIRSQAGMVSQNVVFCSSFTLNLRGRQRTLQMSCFVSAQCATAKPNTYLLVFSVWHPSRIIKAPVVFVWKQYLYSDASEVKVPVPTERSAATDVLRSHL